MDATPIPPKIWAATYGAGNRTYDIKPAVVAALRSGQGFWCNNGTFGDPAQGSGKQCKISYRLGRGLGKEIIVGEGGYFDPNLIPFSAGYAALD
jgi:hypothetical protein